MCGVSGPVLTIFRSYHSNPLRGKGGPLLKRMRFFAGFRSFLLTKTGVALRNSPHSPSLLIPTYGVCRPRGSIFHHPIFNKYLTTLQCTAKGVAIAMSLLSFPQRRGNLYLLYGSLMMANAILFNSKIHGMEQQFSILDVTSLRD